MGLKDILLHVGDAPGSEARIALAAGLAREHGARLTALCTMRTHPSVVPGPAGFGYGNAPIVEEALIAMQLRATQEAEALAIHFRDTATRAGITGEWIFADDESPQEIAGRARLFDLAILAQADPEDPTVALERRIVTQVLLTSGRPVLVVPYAGRFGQVGTRVLVAWNGSREAARAVHDAMPFLRRAQAVTVLAVDSAKGAPVDEPAPAAALVEHLARHGIAAKAARTVAEGISAGEALLSYACDISADLLVSGGYSHSPAREVLLGGVTRSSLTSMTLPVLLSH